MHQSLHHCDIISSGRTMPAYAHLRVRGGNLKHAVAPLSSSLFPPPSTPLSNLSLSLSLPYQSVSSSTLALVWLPPFLIFNTNHSYETVDKVKQSLAMVTIVCVHIHCTSYTHMHFYKLLASIHTLVVNHNYITILMVIDSLLEYNLHVHATCSSLKPWCSISVSTVPCQ